MDRIELTLEQARRRKRLVSPEMRRLLREQAGLTQTELAVALGVTRGAVSRWESGTRNPSRRVADRYLDALDRMRNAF